VNIVLDTNVFVSGVFFPGPPSRILKAWRDKTIQIVLSREILKEYRRVGAELAAQYPPIDIQPIIELIVHKALIVDAAPLPEQVCKDADDDKFIACALAAGCHIIVSGDKHLLKVSGFQGIQVLKPREFVDRYLVG
jgi:putative PIN family toxin of toxin-antitoxin system